MAVSVFVPDKTIKLWKVSERDKRPEGYNLKDEEGRIKDISTVTSLQVTPIYRSIYLASDRSLFLLSISCTHIHKCSRLCNVTGSVGTDVFACAKMGHWHNGTCVSAWGRRKTKYPAVHSSNTTSALDLN